jgi:hypothetical protein
LAEDIVTVSSPCLPRIGSKINNRGMLMSGSRNAAANAILIELNELCPALWDRWIAAGYLTNFQRLHQGSKIFVGDPQICQQTRLESPPMQNRKLAR